MKNSKDYIIFPLDFSSAGEALEYVKLLDGNIGVFKIGLELFIKEGPGMVELIRKSTNAGIFLDLKLHDISITVKRAMQSAVQLGADLITVHCSSVNMLKAAVLGGAGRAKVLGVTLLTDNDKSDLEAAGIRQKYCSDIADLVLKRAQMAYKAGCAGVVCSGKEVRRVKQDFGEKLVCVTPGIRPAWSVTDNDDQKRITTPGMAVRSGSDFIVVGRPVRDAVDVVKAARKIALEIEEALLPPQQPPG